MAEEFNGLDCSVCHELLQEPKQLTCGHTFCKKCLVLLFQSQLKENELYCPDCLKITLIKDGDVANLNADADIESRLEAMQTAETRCSVCEEEEDQGSEATAYCQTCREHLCERCLEIHRKWKRNASHEVVSVADVRSGSAKVRRFCANHAAEEVERICLPCRIAVCFRCSVNDHAGPEHEVEDVSAFKLKVQCDIRDMGQRSQTKATAIEAHLRVVDEESSKVDGILDGQINNINQMFEENVRVMIAKRNELVEKCQEHKTILAAEFQHIRESGEKLLTSVQSASTLVGHGTKVLLEGQALNVHGRLKRDLQEKLAERDPSLEQPRNITKGAENVEFRMHRGQSHGLGFGEVVLNNWTLDEINKFPLAGTDLYDLVPTQDGKMAVGYLSGGIELFTADGPQETIRTASSVIYRASTPGGRPGRRASKTVLEFENVGRVGVLSDGRFVVQDEKHNLSLYTRDWKKADIVFETLCEEGGFGGMAVDPNDWIYVGYWSARKILVFKPDGGAPIRDIPCHDYEPVEICAMHHHKMLVVRDLLRVRVVDEQGDVKYDSNKSFPSARLAVLGDDSVLIGWVNDDGLLNVDLYTHRLKFVNTVLKDFKVDGEFRMLREFSTGEVALCDDKNFYVFGKSK